MLSLFRPRPRRADWPRIVAGIAAGLAILRDARIKGFLLRAPTDLFATETTSREHEVHVVLKAWQLGRCRDFLYQRPYIPTAEVDAFVAMLCVHVADPDHEKVAKLMHAHYALVDDPVSMIGQTVRDVLEALRMDDVKENRDTTFSDMLTLASASWMVVAEVFGDRRTARQLDEMSS